MLENQTVETLEKTLPKVLTNEEVHLQKFNEYLFVTVVITQAVSDRLIKVILNKKEDDIKSKERLRVKQRNFKLISENNSHKLGQEVKIKEHSIETKKVLPVLVFEDFYKVIHKVHLEVGHSGINRCRFLAISAHLTAICRW